MDKLTVPIRLRWIPAEQRGRKAPPNGPRYSTTIRFDSFAFSPGESWSVVIDEMQTRNGESEGMMGFLSDEAPIEALRTGGDFTLFEGRWPVAEGRVLAAVPALSEA